MKRRRVTVLEKTGILRKRIRVIALEKTTMVNWHFTTKENKSDCIRENYSGKLAFYDERE